MCTTLVLLYMALMGSRAASVHERSAQLPDLVAKGPVVPALVAPGRHTVLTGLAQTPVMNVDTVETRVPGKIVTVVKQAKTPVMQTGATTFQTRQAAYAPMQSERTSQAFSQPSPVSFTTGYMNAPRRTVTTQTLVPQSGQVLVEALPPKPLTLGQVPDAVFQRTGEFQSGMLTPSGPSFENMQRFTAQEGVSVGPGVPPRQQVQFQTGIPVTVRPAMSAKLMAAEEMPRRPIVMNRRPETRQNIQYQSGYMESMPTVATQTVPVPTQVNLRTPVLPPRQMVQFQSDVPVSALPVGPVETPAPSPPPQSIVTQQIPMAPPTRSGGMYSEVREVVQPAPVLSVSPPQPVPISVRTSQVTPPVTTTREEVSIGTKNVLTETVMPHLVEGRRPAVMNRPFDSMVASTERPVVSGPVSPKQRVTVTHSEQPLYFAPAPPVAQVAPIQTLTVTQAQPVNPIPVVEQAVPVPTTYAVPIVSAPPLPRHRVTTTQVRTEAMAPPLPVISTLPPVPAAPVALEKVVAPLPQPVAPTRIVTSETLSAPVPTVALPPPSVMVKGPPPQPIIMQSPPPRVVKIPAVHLKHVPPPMVTTPPPPPPARITLPPPSPVTVTSPPPPPTVMVTSPPPSPVMVTSSPAPPPVRVTLPPPSPVRVTLPPPPSPVMVTFPPPPSVRVTLPPPPPPLMVTMPPAPPPVFTSLPSPGPTQITTVNTSRPPPTHIQATIVPPPIGSVITTVEPSVTTAPPQGTATYEAGWKEYEVTATPETVHRSHPTSENVVQVDRTTEETETLPHHMQLAADQPYPEEEREEKQENSGRILQQPKPEKLIAHDLTHDADKDTETVDVNVMGQTPKPETHTDASEQPLPKNKTIIWNLSIAPVPERVSLTVRRGNEKIYDAEYNRAGQFVKVDGEKQAVEKCFWYYSSDTMASNPAKEPARGQPGANALPMRYTGPEARPNRRKNGHPRVRVIEQIQMPPQAQADMFARTEDFFPEGPQSKKPALPVKSLETTTGIKNAEGSGMKHVGKVPSEGHIFWTPDHSRRGQHMGQQASSHHDHGMVSGDQVPHVRLPVYFSNVQRKRKSD